jgi:chromosome segregation ATPase
MNQNPDIPIPSERVAPVQVSQLAGLTPSAALESLISQNIDLSTRLNINLRRVADMENAIKNLGGQVQGFESQKEAFREEIQVLHKRFQAQESKLLTFRIDKENAEKSYAGLVMEYKAFKEKFDSEKSMNEGIQLRYAKFRFRIHNQIRPLFKSLQADSQLLPLVQKELGRFKKYRERIQKIARPYIRNLKFQLNTFKERCERLEVKNSELAVKIEELLNHLRTRKEAFESDQRKLVTYHEDRYNENNAKLEAVRMDLTSMTKRFEEGQAEIARLKGEKDRIEEEGVSLHNRTIAAERSLGEIESRYQGDIQALQDRLGTFEQQWKTASEKLDLTSVQLEAAQRLNGSLAEDLRQEREQAEEFKSRIRQLKIQEVAQQSARHAEPLLAVNPSIPQQIIEEVAVISTPVENLGITKIEALFAEIQSGDMGSGRDDADKNS